MKTIAIGVLVLLAVAASACRKMKVEVDRPQFGGDPERALVAATAARDVARVQSLLRSGADPNRMVRHEGLNRSAWELALTELGPKRPELVPIIQAMLKAGAKTESAWGESVSRGITRQYTREPIGLVMLHPDARVVRALMEAGLDPRAAQTALVMAVEHEEAEIVHILVEAGVDVNCHPPGNTPLVAAVEARNFELMTYLEDHGAREKP